MNRRTLLCGLTATLATSRAVQAQQAGKVYRVGFLGPGSAGVEVFLTGLRDLGYVVEEMAAWLADGRALAACIRIPVPLFSRLVEAIRVMAGHTGRSYGGQLFQDSIPGRPCLHGVGQRVEPPVSAHAELTEIRWEFLFETRIERRHHPGSASGLLSHREITGYQPVHDPAERLQHRSHLEPNHLSFCRCDTHSLPTVGDGLRAGRSNIPSLGQGAAKLGRGRGDESQSRDAKDEPEMSLELHPWCSSRALSGAAEAAPSRRALYCLQIFQITPVPGIWTSGASAGSMNLLAGSDRPKSRTAP
jgi:hypothetical protein